MSTPNTVLLSAAAALAGKAVATEEEAQTVLTAIAPEVVRLRAFEAQVGVELGEVEVAKAVTRIKALKTENAEWKDKHAAAEKARIDTVIDTTMKGFEDRLTPFARDTIFVPALRTELEKNPALVAKDSQTVKALTELKPHGITSQSSSGDVNATLSDDPDTKLDQVARQLLTTEPDLIALAKTNPDRAMDQAQDRAAKQIGYVSDQVKHARSQLTTK